MKLLLDSHVFLWWFAQPENLDEQALKKLESGESELYVSAASWWELSIKRALQRIRVDLEAVLKMLDRAKAERLAVTFEHAERAASLPPYHNDPFDRMLAAQALQEGLTLMTRDRAFHRYNVPLLKA